MKLSELDVSFVKEYLRQEGGLMEKVNKTLLAKHKANHHPKDNIQCENAIKIYKDCLKLDIENTYFIAITLEKIIEAISQVSEEKSANSWFNIFYDRYLNFTKINELS